MELYDLYSLLTKCYLGDQLKKNEMGELCGTYVGEERDMGFGGESCWKETALKAWE